MAMCNKRADLMTQTFITRFDWKVRVSEWKNADSADVHHEVCSLVAHTHVSYNQRPDREKPPLPAPLPDYSSFFPDAPCRFLGNSRPQMIRESSVSVI